MMLFLIGVILGYPYIFFKEFIQNNRMKMPYFFVRNNDVYGYFMFGDNF
jgi:hypothetical protein